MVRDEILELKTNHEKNMLVNNKLTPKASVARLMHCINYIEAGDLNTPEQKIIDDAIDEVLHYFIKIKWEKYFSFQQDYIKQRYDALLLTVQQ